MNRNAYQENAVVSDRYHYSYTFWSLNLIIAEKCPIDQIYKLCPPSCEIHCANVNNPPKNCPEDETEEHECIADCICPSGLVRDYFTKKCVNKQLCSAGMTFFINF
jgi:hypothetical protein